MSDNKTPNNPPAFPRIDESRVDEPWMSLRDYFAAKAMQAGVSKWSHFWDEGGVTYSRVAEQSYKIADAMLKEREKQP